jgi:hypothetical protein
VVDRLGQAKHLQQAGGLRDEHRHAVGTLRVRAVVELAGHAVEVGLERLTLLVGEVLLLTHESGGAVQQGPHLGGPSRGRGELPGVEIEEEGEHLGIADGGLGEPAQALAGEVVGLHGATLPRPRTGYASPRTSNHK